MLLTELAAHDPLYQLFLIRMIADRPRKLQVQRSRGHQLQMVRDSAMCLILIVV